MPPPGDTAPARIEELHARPGLGFVYAPVAWPSAGRGDPAESPAVPDHPRYLSLVFVALVAAAAGARAMGLTLPSRASRLRNSWCSLADAARAGVAPGSPAWCASVKARLQRRHGPPILQPYRDLRRLLGKEVVLADNASWLFRVAPYLIFAATWVAAALVPTFATGLHVQLVRRPDRDHRAARHCALPPGACRAWISAPASAASVSTRGHDRLARRAGDDHDRVHGGADRRLHPAFHHRRFHVDDAAACACRWHGAGRVHHRGAGRERAHPGRQSGDASGTDHGARGDGAGIFRPPSGDDRAGGLASKLLLYISLIACIFLPFGLVRGRRRPRRVCRSALLAYLGKLARRAACCWRCSKRRSPRCGCSACPTSSASR